MKKKQIPDTFVTLRDLFIGDYFIHYSEKNKRLPIRYRVLDTCAFNLAHGSSTRQCCAVLDGSIKNKSCNLKVIKIESHVKKEHTSDK